MNSSNTQPIDNDKSGLYDFFILSFCVLWAFLFVLICYEFKFDVLKSFSQIIIYGTIAGGLFFMMKLVNTNYKAAIGKKILLTLLRACHIVLVVIGIVTNSTFIRNIVTKDQTSKVRNIIAEVKDSASSYKSKFNIDDLYNNCKGMGVKIKHYTDSLIFLKLKDVPEQQQKMYKSTIDSAIIDPVTELCGQAKQYEQMVMEMNVIIYAKNINRIDAFFQKYHIQENAKAIELINGNVKIARGSLRNYLVDIIQELHPMYKTIKPAYFVKGSMIDEIIFINI